MNVGRLARRTLALALLLYVSFAGCGGSNKPTSSNGSMTTTRSPVSGDDDAGEAPSDPCKGAAMGAPCGDDLFCIHGECVVNTCGDDVQADGEECDDGNVADGDGCDAGCKLEPTGCGNGIVDSGEECDDGNTIDDDDCSNSCMKNECGNSRVDVNEECDDGNKVDTDKCSNKCTINRCRNGRVDPGEQCDDGNEDNNDGCTNNCRVMICGNGKQEEKEECDDGNTIDDDGCSNHCTLNVCGNMRVDPGEDCDGTANCSSTCKLMPDTCTPCEAKYCTNYMDTGIDLVKGCREGQGIAIDQQLMLVDTTGKAQVKPEVFSQTCTAVLECAQVSQCVGSNMGAPTPESCFCGNESNDACTQNGPAADAACTQQWYNAASSMAAIDVVNDIADFGFVTGWAYYLLSCDYENCKSECLPGTP